jgi:hypothetical protein
VPFLREKDRLIISKTSYSGDLKIGDLILYSKDNQLICHRLVKKDKMKARNLIYAQGDNSASLEIVDENMFQGKVIAILRNGRIKNISTRRQRFINYVVVKLSPLIRA